MLPITTTSPDVSALICFVLLFTLYGAWRKDRRNNELKLFIIFITFLAFALSLFALALSPTIIGTSVSNWIWIIGNSLIFFGSCFILRFAMRLRHIRREKLIFSIALLVALAGAAINVVYQSSVRLVILPNGVINWVVPPQLGAVVVLVSVFSYLSTFFIFISQIGSLSSKVLKLRSLTLAIGIILFFIGGPLHDFAKTPLVYFIADATMIAGIIIMAFGIFIPKFLKFETENHKTS